MILDAIGIIIIILFFIRGYSRGFIVAIFSVIAILLGSICALKLSHVFAAWMLEKGYATSAWVMLIAYIVLFVGVVMLVRLVAKLIEKVAEGLMLGFINRLIGGGLYAFLGALVWSIFLWLAAHIQLIPP